MHAPFDFYIDTTIFTRWMSDDMITAMTPSLLGDYPNTYTFTKGLAEHIVTTESGEMPVAIVRPSIIAGSYREPSPVSFQFHRLKL